MSGKSNNRTKRKLCGSVFNTLLVFAMVFSMVFGTSAGMLSANAAGEESSSQSLGESKVTDVFSIQAGDQMYDMVLYMNSLWETAVTLPAGTTEVTLYKNGEQTSLTSKAETSEEGKVYFRYQDGEFMNSVNDKFVHTAALTGNFNGLEFLDEEGNRFDIASWTPEDANGELNYLGGGLYSRTFHFKELAEAVEIADGGYKVAFDDSWDYSIGEGDGNIALTVPAGASELTIFADEIGKVVYDSVRTPAFESTHNSGAVSRTAFATAISLIGTVRGNEDTNWDASATGWEFTPISETLYRYQLKLAAGSYAYKCVFDYTDWYEAEADNRSLQLDADTTVVVLYDTASGKLYDTVNNADETAQFLNMISAPAEAKVTDNANGTTTFQTVAEDGSDVKLFYAAKADAEAGKSFQSETLKAGKGGAYTSKEIYFGDAAIDVVYYYEVNGTKTLDSTKESVSVNGEEYSHYTRDTFSGRMITVAGTLPGPQWDPTANEMAYQGNGIYSLTFKDVPATDYQYKIACNKSWDPENYGKDGVEHGANIEFTVPEKQDVTITYNDISHYSVNSVDYRFIDIDLSGKNVPADTKLKDEQLTGIYSATVKLAADKYDDIKISYTIDGKDYEFTSSEFELEEEKDVTFFFDPETEIFYNNASDVKVEEKNIYFNSKDDAYKSPYGAVAAGTKVSFSIKTGEDATDVSLIISGTNKQTVVMNEKETKDGVKTWNTEVEFTNMGENHYYFVITNGSSVCVYADDDGYFGEGQVTDLTTAKSKGYDQVVYKEGFETPDWMKNAVVYQIFPDRFFDGNALNNQAQTTARGAVNYEFINDWYTLPENPEQEGLLSQEAYESYGAYWGDGNWSNEMYGGDLDGITDKIEYLKALGVNVIYLNPVFSSISSHRYDTSDYEIIDPILGTEGDFTELVEVAEANDMHIILDGVFNHVSDDSKYFDRYYKYLEKEADADEKDKTHAIGAYPYWAYVYDYMAENDAAQEDAENAAKTYFTDNYGITDYAYTEWFEVYQSELLAQDTQEPVTDEIGLRAGKTVYGYEGWWGYDSMPVIKSTEGSEYQTGNWADEIIYNEDGTSVTQYWLNKGSDGWRLDVANEVSDETWKNFRDSVKSLDSDNVIVGEIWSDATYYLMGDMYDSVMNYVFRDAMLSYAKGGDAEYTVNTLERIRERYPEEAFYAMMNLVGSHDTTRVLSALDGISDDRADKSAEANFPTYENTSDLAKQRQYLVAFLQFTYAGAPTIYYGDEIGMVGADDPDDRRGFTWGRGNQELVTWYATLAAIRNEYPTLRTGTLESFDPEDTSLMGYVRRDDENAMIVVANNSEEATEVTLDLNKLDIKAEKLTNLITSDSFDVTDNTVTVTVPALSGIILTDSSNAKEVTVNQSALASAYDPASIVTPENRPVKPVVPENPDDPATPVDPENPDQPTTPEDPDKDVTNGDNKTPTSDKTTTSTTNKTTNTVKTGDSSDIALWVVLMALAVGSGTVVVVRKVREHK